MSFLVLTISIGHFGVSCQYIQYRPTSASPLSLSARLASALSDKRFDTVTEYEYYDDDDEIDDFGTTQSFSPTTTARATTTTTTKTTSTTTTPKPITSYRLMTTHRNGFRPILNSNSNNGNTKKKTDTTITRQNQQYQPDSYTEASNESTFVQKQNNNQSKQSTSTPQLRNAIADVNRRSAGKEYAQEKSSSSAVDSSNGSSGGFSRRYARFLFKSRSG